MIEEILKDSDRPCVLFSGGVDSLLVLSKVREFKKDIPVYVFKRAMTIDQWALIERIIRLWDLEVRTFPPSHSYFVPNGDELTLVDEYNLNGMLLPVIRDFVHSDEHCSLKFDEKRLPVFPFDHDTIFIGTRKEDTHPISRPFKKELTGIGPYLFVAPVFNWSKSEIMEAVKDLPYSKEFYELGNELHDTGNVVACSRCVSGEGMVHCPILNKEIPSVEWNKQEMLKTFTAKYGFEVMTNAN
jgi:hypothetical protein